MRNQAAIILAAGKGSRMRSLKAKVLHEVGGVPMIVRVIGTALRAGISNIAVVVGHQADEVRSTVTRYLPNTPVKWALQYEQLGTAHAALCAESLFKGFSGDVWILSGDVPLLSPQLIRDIGRANPESDLVITSMMLDDPGAYGRILRSPEGNVRAIREFADCTPPEAQTPEVNAGLYRVDSDLLFKGLRTVKANNAQSEYYLTDLVDHAIVSGADVSCKTIGIRAFELLGVNTPEDLARAQLLLKFRLDQS